MEKIGVGIGILVYNDKGELLLIKRSSDPFEADSEMRLEGTYTLPSGKMLPLESFEAAAKRKLKEEVGLDVLESDLKLVSISNDLNDYATDYDTNNDPCDTRIKKFFQRKHRLFKIRIAKNNNYLPILYNIIIG